MQTGSGSSVAAAVPSCAERRRSACGDGCLTPVAGLIVNPVAGKGAAGRKFREITRSFAAVGIQAVKETAGSGDEDRVTREALDEGWRTIAVVGGDGTCSRVADTVLRLAPECSLAVVPAGTGNDFAKTVGVAHYTLDQIARLTAAGAYTRIDVGIADDRYFINSCGFGFNASVLEASAGVRFLTGDALYIYAALAQLFSYRGLPLAIDGDSSVRPSDRLLMVAVSNGQYVGGAFRIAPEASVTDGQLDVCVIRDANAVERVRLFAAAMRGTHGQLPAVRMLRRAKMIFQFEKPPSIELDGELRQARSAEVRIDCVPRALKVIAAKDSIA